LFQVEVPDSKRIVDKVRNGAPRSIKPGEQLLKQLTRAHQWSDDILFVSLHKQHAVSALALPRAFIYGWTALKSARFAGMRSVVSIGDSSFTRCDSFIHFSFDAWPSLLEIGNSVLFQCAALTRVDLRGTCNVKKIGNSFLANCLQLAHVLLPEWQDLTTLGDTFLYQCTALKHLDLSRAGMDNLESIGHGFMGCCVALEVFVAPPWLRVATVDVDFLVHCDALTRVVIPPAAAQPAAAASSREGDDSSPPCCWANVHHELAERYGANLSFVVESSRA
jgi:hypothetical protein